MCPFNMMAKTNESVTDCLPKLKSMIFFCLSVLVSKKIILQHAIDKIKRLTEWCFPIFFSPKERGFDILVKSSLTVER